jgi:hypothetical protein
MKVGAETARQARFWMHTSRIKLVQTIQLPSHHAFCDVGAPEMIGDPGVALTAASPAERQQNSIDSLVLGRSCFRRLETVF